MFPLAAISGGKRNCFKVLFFKRQISAKGDGWEIRRGAFWKEAMSDGANSAMTVVLFSFSSALNQSRKYVYHLY